MEERSRKEDYTVAVSFKMSIGDEIYCMNEATTVQKTSPPQKKNTFD